MIKDNELDFFIKNNYNVMFIGKHGVGKTAVIKEAFERNGLNWLYFSAASIDPWVDFIGVPREKDGFLELVRPKVLSKPVDAIFLDEWNRANPKVRNATMELIQFGTINGEPLAGIKMVWVAINPDDDDDEKYDVEVLDPAQKDRFHFHIEIPYKPHLPYFTEKYGTLGSHAVQWWSELPTQQKNKVSPRRLDYALDVYNNGGNLRYVLDKSTHINKLINILQTGPIIDRLNDLMSASDEDIKTFFLNENNFADSKVHIVKNKKMLQKFLHLMSNEKIAYLISKYKTVERYVDDNVGDGKFLEILENIVKAGGNIKLTKNIQKLTKSVGKFDLSNTENRRKAYDIISYKVENSLITTDQDIRNAINALNEIVSRTHVNGLKIYKDIKKIVAALEIFGNKAIKNDKTLLKTFEAMKLNVDLHV